MPNRVGDAARQLAGLDRVIHEPSRLAVLAVLSVVDEADFLYLLRETGLTKGNLTVHLSRLEEAGYIRIEKTFAGKVPRTICSLTEHGRAAFAAYRSSLRAVTDPRPRRPRPLSSSS